MVFDFDILIGFNYLVALFQTLGKVTTFVMNTSYLNRGERCFGRVVFHCNSPTVQIGSDNLDIVILPTFVYMGSSASTSPRERNPFGKQIMRAFGINEEVKNSVFGVFSIYPPGNTPLCARYVKRRGSLVTSTGKCCNSVPFLSSRNLVSWGQFLRGGAFGNGTWLAM